MSASPATLSAVAWSVSCQRGSSSVLCSAASWVGGVAGAHLGERPVAPFDRSEVSRGGHAHHVLGNRRGLGRGHLSHATGAGVVKPLQIGGAAFVKCLGECGGLGGLGPRVPATGHDRHAVYFWYVFTQ